MDSGIYLRRRLLAAGFGDHEVRRMLRDGSLQAIRPGAYVTELADEAAAQHALLVRAAVAELSPDAVVSHVSAAVVHGLRVWGIRLDRVEVTRARRRSGARLGSRVHVHCAPLEADEVVLVEGLPVTSVPRTVVDVARTVGFEQAVVGRADLGWPRRRTVGEFDGRVKYGELLRPGQDPTDVGYEEKLREDALRAEDLAVVRWTWPDLSCFVPVATRLRERFRPT